MVQHTPGASNRRHRVAALLAALAVAAVGIVVVATRLLESGPVDAFGSSADGPITFVARGQESTVGVDNREIYAVSPDSGELRNVTNSLSAERDPAWSPDGTRVAFLAASMSRAADNELVLHQGVYVMRADGSDLRELLPCEKPVCEIRDLSWSPNGTRIAFVADSASSGRLESALFVIDADGGEARELCSGVQRCGQGIADPVWSPDGTRILFSNQDVVYFSGPGPGLSAIFIADPNGGGVTRLTNHRCIPGTRRLRGCAFDSAPAWSPDGTRIAFGHVDTTRLRHQVVQLEVMQPDGSDRRTLYTCRGLRCRQLLAGRWAPNGESIAFVARLERPAITVVPLGGGEAREVRTCAGTDCVEPYALTWSPNGGRFAFIGDEATYVIELDGEGLRKVAEPVEGCCLTWLPQSAEEELPPPTGDERVATPSQIVEQPPILLPGLIAFAGDRTAPGNEEHQLYTMRSDGSHLGRLTFRTEYNVEPSWSPDGEKIAFSGFDGGPNQEIFVMAADGTGVREITKFKYGAGQPDWSPDGSLITFVAQADDGDSELFLVAPDGTGLRQLTDTPGGIRAPDWSPDGSQILLERFDDEGGTDLFTFDVSTRDLAPLARLPGAEQDPAWSPDGSTIVFDWSTVAGEGLYLMNADGTGLRRLSGAPSGHHPTWSPDGSRVVFHDADDRWRFVIYVIAIDGSSLSIMLREASNLRDPAWQPIA